MPVAETHPATPTPGSMASNSSTPATGTEGSAGSSPTTVKVPPPDRAVIGPEVEAFVRGLRDDTARAEYTALAAAIDRGEVGAPELTRLESFLELVLTTGRIRSRLGLHAEDAVRRLYERTPRGAAQSASAAEVTQALASLVGQELRDLQLSQVRPGTFRLVVETARFRVTVGLAPAGAHVENVEATL